MVQKIVKQKIYLLICGVIFVLNRVIARQEKKNKPCCCPWVLKDDSKPYQIKYYYFIQEHFNNVLQPPSKKNKARYSSISICNIVQDSNVIIVLNSYVNNATNIDSSRQDVNLDLDSNSIASTTSIVLMVSGEIVQTTFQLNLNLKIILL